VEEAVLARLRAVEFLAGVDEEALCAFAALGQRRRYAPGEHVFAELEASSELYVILEGRAEIAVESRSGARQVLEVIGPGNAFGEMSSLTGEPRSATVVAVEPLEALCFDGADFAQLRVHRPAVALALTRTLAARLANAERKIDALLNFQAPAPGPAEAAPQEHPEAKRGSLRRAWVELVVAKERDLGFLALATFALTLLAVRLAVFLSFQFDLAPRQVLRAAYMTGFSLLIGSAWASLTYFRPGLRRWIAAAYGVGLALIFNELGVTLAFDIFYRDIHTRDPSVAFDVERLYRRTEGPRAIFLGLLFLVQLAYLRPFYRRAVFMLRTRLRKLSAGAGSGAARPGG
jgi:CRP-like cAMP-binding protein